MKGSNTILPIPNCIGIIKNKINHYTLSAKQVNKSETLSQSVKTVTKHLQPSKKPQATETSRLADLEADVFTPENPTSNGIYIKPKNANSNHGDKASMEKYFDAPLPDEAQIAKGKWYAEVAAELEHKDMQKTQARQKQYEDTVKVWEEHLGV